MVNANKAVYILLIAAVFSFVLITSATVTVTLATALLLGSACAFIIECPYSKFNKNMTFTATSAFGIVTLGIATGYLLKLNSKTPHLFSYETTFCRENTTVTVGTVSKADREDSQTVTSVKLTRALRLIQPVSITMLLFRYRSGKIVIPWFILLFIVAIIANTYCDIPSQATSALVWIANKGLVLTIFAIGASLSLTAIKQSRNKTISARCGFVCNNRGKQSAHDDVCD